MNDNKLIHGTGEMAVLTRTYDWDNSPIGPISQWPDSLLTTINIILSSKCPMFLWWGEDLIQFYNDAYRPSFGVSGKHPQALGKRGVDTWSEIWHIIKPLIDIVKLTGEPVWSENQLIPIYRNNSLEEVYWTFGYSAVYRESGEIGGVLVVCQETTQQVIAQKSLEESKDRLEVALSATEKSAVNFRNLVLQTPVAMCILQGPDLVVEVANDAVCEIWGKRREQVQGKPIFEGLPEAREQGLEELLNHVYNSGERITAYERPVLLPRTGGLETVYLNFVYEALKDSDGNMMGVMAVANDVTSQVLDRLKIAESENNFRQLADSIPQIIWTAGPDGIINYYNKQWYQITGYTDEENENWLSVIHPDDLEKLKTAYTDSINTGTKFNGEYRFRDNRSGEYKWFLVNVLPIKDADNKITKWFGSCTDIDPQKSSSEKMEAKVAERTIELQKINDELQSFAYVASHDLQEPLRKIQTFSDRILEKEQPNLSENGKGYFKRLQSATGRMQQFITDLLNYSRTNNKDFNTEKVNLDKLITEVLTDFKEVIEKKEADIEHHADCEACVIPYQFRQVIQNLLSNSLKFAEPDKNPVIRIKAEIKTGAELGMEKLQPDLKYCHIIFTDNGIGFEPQYNTRIFEMFQRLNGRSEYEGSGIGLAIVNKIMENHKGLITANSAPKEGAQFDIYIPHYE